MLTTQWFNDNIPEKVENYEDYRQVINFLRNWRDITKNVEEVYAFIINTDDKELAQMSMKAWKLANAFLDFCTDKYTMLGDFLKSNKRNLSAEQAMTIFEYSEKDVEESKSIANALKTVASVLEIKRERK